MRDLRADVDAARDGVRMLVAEARRLESELEDAKCDSAECVSRLARRAAIVASSACSILTTLTRHLPEAAAQSIAEARAEASHNERMAWSEGVQAGANALRPENR